jgi:hypothetical protein
MLISHSIVEYKDKKKIITFLIQLHLFSVFANWSTRASGHYLKGVNMINFWSCLIVINLGLKAFVAAIIVVVV